VSSPEPSGPPRPLRIAGLALVAVAVAATIAGILTIIGDDDDSAAPPPTNTTAPTNPTDDTAPTDTTATGEPPSPGTSATAPSPGPTSPGQPAPPVTTTAAPPPAQPPPVTAVPVRVYNNSTIQGHAARAAEDFRRGGWRVDEVSNYSAGIIPTSTVYFRPGTDEEAAARALANRFDLRVEPRFAGIAQASPGLIVIVTNDYGNK
jgi:hypothetical protein